jgi:hypothetical protein
MHQMNAHIENVLLTPEVDEMQVDDELDDLHSSQVLLPLEGVKTMQVSMIICTRMGNCGASY